MRVCLAVIAFCLWVLTVPASAQPATSITTIYGSQVACVPESPVCNPPPQNFTTLCNQFVVGVSCPKSFHPSWVDSSRYWGSDGTSCVTSSNGGVNWANCATQPFAGGTVHVASSTNGHVIAVSDVFGLCTFMMSVNNGTSWSTQFTGVNTCAPTPSGSEQIRCQPASGQCDYVFVQSGVGVRAYRSTDNGATWAQTDTGSAVAATVSSMVFNGSRGMAGGVMNTGNVATFAVVGTWVLSTPWGAPTNNFGETTASDWGSIGTPVGFVFEGVTTLQYKQINTDGTVLKSFVPPGAMVVGFPIITCFQFNSSVDYCVGLTTTGGQGFWVSIDDLASLTLLASNTALAGKATIYSVNGGIYISVAGTVGAFYRIT